MNALKIFAQIILICLLLALPSISHAELQGNLFRDDVVTVDGETFNVGELNKALDGENIDAAESIYNDWVKRRQKMLGNGAEFEILDIFIKHCHSRILYLKENYEECITTEDEILDYLFSHLNEEHEKNYNWINQIYNSMIFKKFSYDELDDYANSLKVQKNLVNFLEKYFPADNPEVLEEKMDLSVCYARVNDYESATALDEELLPQIEKVFGAKSAKTRKIKYYLAEDYSNSLRNLDAAKLYEEILKSDIETYGETDKKTIVSYEALIEEYVILGKFEEMGTLLNRVVPIAETNLDDDSELKRNILGYQALYYIATEQIQKSSEILDKILNSTINNEYKIFVSLAMSNNFIRLGDYSNTLKYNLKAWEIYEKNLPENKFIRSQILRFTSLIYLQLGNISEGLKYAQEALDLSIELHGKDHLLVSFARNALIYAYSTMNQYDKVVELGKENYELCINLLGEDTPYKIEPMLSIATAYYFLKDYNSGITWAKKAVDESTRLWGEKNVRTLIGQIALSGFYRKNKDTVDEAIKILENLLKIDSALFSEQEFFEDIALLNLAYAYEKSPRWKEALPLYEKVIESRENRMDSYGALTVDEKRNIFSDESSVYVDAAALYYRDNNFKDAFRTFERGRSRLLIDSYAEQIVKSSGILDKKEIAKLNEYKAGLANYANLIDAAFKSGNEQTRLNLESEQRNLSNEYVAYKKILQDKYHNYKNASQANKLDLERDKNILPADTAFVDYMISGKNITAFVFDSSGDVKAVQFEMPENFLGYCNFYHELLAYPNLETMQKGNVFLLKSSDAHYYVKFDVDIEKGSGLKRVTDNQEFKDLKKVASKYIGDVLLAPLAEHISKYQNLIIAPDKDLNALPFETLEFNGKLAVENFNISYVPSFSVLKLMYEAGEKNSQLTNRQDLYAMGNAFYGDNDEDAAHRSLDNFFRGQRGEIALNQFRNLSWNNLPGSKEEINRVSKIFSNPKIFSEKSASESNLKASNKRDELSKYKYLLFSTHGIFIPYAPEYSSIVLSQGVDKNEDGYVTIGEWAGLDLNSDVVFLSACETGLGEYQAGEGIVGIPYALTIAGNKNTVMSLWKVYDVYTPEFVSTFFNKMKEGKSALIAINETKREFLKNTDEMYSDPSVWSAFVLYGF